MSGARQDPNGYWHAFIIEANARNLSPLHFAALQGFEDIAKYLIEHGSSINSLSIHHETPLFLAAQENKIKIVKILLMYKLNLDIPDNKGMTPLYIAALKGNLEIVNQLIQYGANQKLMNQDGYSALVAAVFSRRIEVVEAVLNTGVETRQLTLALEMAVQLNEMEIVNILRAREARLDNLTNRFATPLYIAILENRLRDVVQLLEHFLPYEDITKGNIVHNTTLDVALEKSDRMLLAILIRKCLEQNNFFDFIEKLILEKSSANNQLHSSKTIDTILNLTFEITTAALRTQKDHKLKLNKLIKLLEPHISSAKQSLAKVGYFSKHKENENIVVTKKDTSIKPNKL